MTKEQLPQLPQWLLATLPRTEAPWEIDHRDGVFTFTKEGKLLEQDPEEAFFLNFLKRLRHRNVIFREGLYRFYGTDPSRRYLKLGNGKFLFASTDQDRLAILQRAYKKSQEAEEEFTKRPDFRRAWKFINLHPFLWTPDPWSPWAWNTAGGVQGLEVDLLGNGRLRLEVRGHLWQEGEEVTFGSSYFNPELSVEGKTYEKVIKKLARKLQNSYHLEGTLRKG